jgi:molybdate transport system substrate-binding protein
MRRQPGYDLFLAADVDHPNDLINNYPLSVTPYQTTPSKHLFQYAIGALDLWTNTNGVDVSSGQPAGWSKVAIADPSLAPYGVAAQSVLSKVYSVTLPSAKVDEYSNITNTYNAVQNKTELYGFIARSQICTHGDATPVYSGPSPTLSHQNINSGASTYAPILQGGVEIAHTRTAAQNTELTTFLQYVTGRNFSGSIVTHYCYTLPSVRYR